ncbi:MAG: OmpA family protein [Hyphomicrobiaceae bacterium]
MRCNPWRWLWGVIPVGILAFLTVQWEHERIEADLRQRAETALAAADLRWAVTAFDGRDGLITGQANADDASDRASKVVRDVWGVRITDTRTHLLPKIDPYVWGAALRGNGRVRLHGYVPSDEARSAIIGVAKASFPEREIEDRLELARGAPEANLWLGGVGFAIKQLGGLRSGTVNVRGTGLSIEGEAESLNEYKSVKGALRSGLPSGITLVADRVQPPVVSPFVWSAKRSGNQLLITGYVSDEAQREQVFALAKKSFPRLAIVERLEAAQGAPEGFAAVAKAGLEQLSQLSAGEVRLSDRTLRVVGEAPDEGTAQSVVKALRGSAKGYALTEQITYPKAKPAAVSPYVMGVGEENGIIVVTGYVPTDDARSDVMGLVRRRYANREVRDQLALASGEPPGWRQCLDAGLAAIEPLTGGRLAISDQKLTVWGSTRDEALAEKAPGELRTAANRACTVDAQIVYDAPPEPEITWRAVYDGDSQLIMEGDVIDARTRAALVQSAGRLFPKANVIDRMSLVTAPSSKWPVASELGLKLLAALRRGEAVLNRQELLIRGEAKDAAVLTGVREQLQRQVPKGYTGREVIEVRSDAMIWAEQEAKRKAEDDARRRAEQEEARRKAEEEARRKAEEEARRKAQQQTRESEVQAKRRAEADACQTAMREIAVSGTIRFDWASADLHRSSRPTLDRLAQVAMACPDATIEIEGHTDAEGTPERNELLSERRAQSVVSYLVNSGVPTGRLKAVGYGASRPIAANDTADGRAKNRRIEFTVRPE